MVVKVKEPQPEEVALLRAAAHPLHLPAPGARSGADPRARRLGRDVHRLRDRGGRARAAAAAGADERGRGQDRDAGRCLHAREAAGRPRACCSAACPASRRARSWSSAAASSARTRRRSRSAWAARCMSTTARSTACASSRCCSTAAARRASPRRWRSSSACPRSTSSSAPCSCTAPRRRTSSRAAQLGLMKRHSVLVDVSIDQGGCFETSRPTTHSDPTYEVDGITHYCVANMPGAVPITSTYALTNATMPYVVRLADRGRAARADGRPRFHARAQRRGGAADLRARRP